MKEVRNILKKNNIKQKEAANILGVTYRGFVNSFQNGTTVWHKAFMLGFKLGSKNK